ncbi:MAG: alpha-L-fucosidase [Parvularculaceae bacterium]|nr:alpha-L-fucosidase [Parvularculaceae bacterium]
MFLSSLLAFSFSCAHAQWSVIEGQDRQSTVSFLVEEFSAEEWNASNFAPEESVEAFQDWRYGLMVSYGITADGKGELSWGSASVNERKAPDGNARSDGGSLPMAAWARRDKLLAMDEFDAYEWIDFARKAGFRYIVILAKHHEGFHFWDTAYSEYKVTNSPYGRDFLKEIVDAAHEANMPIGIYYSQRDWYHPDYQPVGWGEDQSEAGPLHPQYIDYQFNVVRELLTKYGKIDIFWWDAVWWGGMFRAPMWESERLTRMVRELQPHIVQNNRASVPGDFDTPEQRMGVFQAWRAWEAVVSLEDTWSYTGQNAKSRDQVIQLLVKSAINNGNLLLSLGPKWSGKFDDDEVDAMLAVGDWLRDNGQAVFNTRGGPWKPHVWGGATWKGATAYLHVLDLKGDAITLPAIDGNSVKTAEMTVTDGDGGRSVHALQVEQQGGKIEITLPKELRNAVDTVVTLQMAQSLEGVTPLEPLAGNSAEAAAGGIKAPFDYELVYGKRIEKIAGLTASSLQAAPSDKTLRSLISGKKSKGAKVSTSSEAAPWISVDLGVSGYVSGLYLDADAQGQAVMVELSVDGETYIPVWEGPTEAGPHEIEVNDFIAGAQTPGRLARFVRVKASGGDPTRLSLSQLGVWMKDSK